jgi:hypothetical protein
VTTTHDATPGTAADQFSGTVCLRSCARAAPQHPEWKDTQPFKGVIENDLKSVAAAGEAGLVDMAKDWSRVFAFESSSTKRP